LDKTHEKTMLLGVDEVSLSLMALTVAVGVALAMKKSMPDTPYSRLMIQSDVSKTRNKVGTSPFK